VPHLVQVGEMAGTWGGFSLAQTPSTIEV